MRLLPECEICADPLGLHRTIVCAREADRLHEVHTPEGIEQGIKWLCGRCRARSRRIRRHRLGLDAAGVTAAAVAAAAPPRSGPAPPSPRVSDSQREGVAAGVPPSNPRVGGGSPERRRPAAPPIAWTPPENKSPLEEATQSPLPRVEHESLVPGTAAPPERVSPHSIHSPGTPCRTREGALAPNHPTPSPGPEEAAGVASGPEQEDPDSPSWRPEDESPEATTHRRRRRRQDKSAWLANWSPGQRWAAAFGSGLLSAGLLFSLAPRMDGAFALAAFSLALPLYCGGLAMLLLRLPHDETTTRWLIGGMFAGAVVASFVVRWFPVLA